MDDQRAGFLGRLFGYGGLSGLFGAANSQSFQMEAQVRDMLREAKRRNLWDMSLESLRYVVLDTETTGFNPSEDAILSIGAVEMKGRQLSEEQTYHSYVSLPEEMIIPEKVVQLTGISNETVAEAPALKTVLKEFLTFAGDGVLIAHHALHEVRFLRAALWRTCRADFSHRVIDTARVAQVIGLSEQIMTLDELAECYQVPVENRHSALGDAKITACLWSHMLQDTQKKGIQTFGDLMERISQRQK